MRVKEQIERRLVTALAPVKLEVVDDSDRHAGHAGAREGGQTHYRIHIVSDAFSGRRRVERHRMVYEALKAEIDAGVHALALTTMAPDEV